MKETLNPKLITSMNQWFTDRGIFDRLQEVREEAEQAKQKEGESA